jgi:drug/metabolite transporter (DMT)-like permease
VSNDVSPAPRGALLGPFPNTATVLVVGALDSACFIGMDAVIKLMTPRYDAVQLSFYRFAGGSVFAVALWAWRRTALPQRRAWRLHVLRSLFLLVSLVGYFHALTLLPLAQTVAISYLAPIFVSVLAIPVLKERPSGAVWAALALGLAGVLLSMVPELGASLAGGGPRRLLGMLSAAVAALAFACVMLLARRQARHDPICTILLIQNLLPMALLAGPAAWTWQPMLATDVGWILLAGGLATLGLLGLTYAFSHLEASRVAPLEYTSFVWAAGLGYFVFGEVPAAGTAASAALIIAGCLLLLRR